MQVAAEAEILSGQSGKAEWELDIRKHPMLALVVSAIAGFAVGGGFTSRIGFALLMVGGRLVVRQTLQGMLVNVVLNDARNRTNRRNPEPSPGRPLSDDPTA